MAITKKRAHKSGGSMRVTLPAEWCHEYKVRHGTELTMVGNRAIVILPPKLLSETEITEMLQTLKTMLELIGKREEVKPICSANTPI